MLPLGPIGVQRDPVLNPAAMDIDQWPGQRSALSFHSIYPLPADSLLRQIIPRCVMKNSLPDHGESAKGRGSSPPNSTTRRKFSFLSTGNLRVVTGGLILGAAILLASQTARADLANGERLARQWCANC